MGRAFDMLVSVVAEHGLDAGALELDAHLIDDLGFDSFDAVDILIRIEAATGVTIDPEELFDVETVRDLVAVIDAALPSS